MPTKTHNTAEIQDTTMSIMTTLTNSGHQPNLNILDKEASSILKQGLLKHKNQYQLLPPHLHRRNADERAIRMFKSHFINLSLCN